MDNTEYLKQKQERFKNLGIPMPIEKPNFDQPLVNVKDPKMLQRINEIKNGGKKNEFNELLSIGEKNGFQAIPEPKKKINNKPTSDTKAPALESFSPKSSGGELDMYEKLFSAETPSIPVQNNKPGQRIQEERNIDDNGSNFLNNFRQKLQSKAMSNGVQVQPVSNSSFGFKNENENKSIDFNEIENKIYEISTEVSKKIAEETVKQVLDRYLLKKQNLQENTYQKVKDDIIKIGDKYFKITPVKVKTK